MGYTGRRSMLRYYIQPKRNMRPPKRTIRFETQPDTRPSTTGAKLRGPGNGAKLTLWLIRWGSPAASMSSLHQNGMLSTDESPNDFGKNH